MMIVKHITPIVFRCQFQPKRLASACGHTILAKKWLLSNAFKGEAKESDFKMCNEEIPELEAGEFLCRAVYWSVDPYMRAYAHNYTLNDTMPGSQIAEVIETRNGAFRVGSLVIGHYGWRDFTVVNPRKTPSPFVGDFEGFPISLGLGYLGFTGNAAYFGFTEIAKPKKSNTFVVSGAGGAVGSHVGQLAKAKGCNVIGICGSKEKCEWLTRELGFDAAIDYKNEDIRKRLMEVACNGVDVYWDNVGGCVSSHVLNQMNTFGKVVVCGAISTYNCDFNWPPDSPTIQGFIYYKQLSIQGFLVNSFLENWDVGIHKNLTMMKSGKLKYKEWITEGFENIPRTFIGMMQGANTGKSLVKNTADKEETDCFTANRKEAKASQKSIEKDVC